MVRITRDTRLNNLNLRIQKGPTYVNFEPHFLWVDYEAESEEELLSYSATCAMAKTSLPIQPCMRPWH